MNSNGNFDESFIAFLESKDEGWYKNFYELLYEIHNKITLDKYFFKKIIRLKDRKININTSDCYFESKSSYGEADFIVEPLTYDHSKKAKDLLEILGVKEVDLKVKIELILDKYYTSDTSKIDFNEHMKHWNLFLEYYEETKDISVLEADWRSPKFILFNNFEHLSPTQNIFLSKPYLDNKLHMLDGVNDCYQLSSKYITLKNKEIFLELIKKLGVHTIIPILQSLIPWEHPDRSRIKEYGTESDYTINEDYDLEDLDNILKKPSFDISLLFWTTIISSDKRKQFATYRRIKTSPKNTAPSTLIYKLKQLNWIPDQNNVFHKPADIKQSMLPKEFIYNDTKGWMSAIGLGDNIRKNKEEYKKTEKLIHDTTGFSMDKLEKAKDAGITNDDLENLISQKNNSTIETSKPINLPKAIEAHNKDIGLVEYDLNPDMIKDEDAYRKKADKKLKDNIKKANKTSKKRYSQSTIKVGKEETMSFLLKQYKVYCQICGFTFDKKSSEGKYFEIFDWLSNKITKQQTRVIDAGSTLCLCAKCHSILKYGDFESKFISNLKKSNIDLTFLLLMPFAKQLLRVQAIFRLQIFMIL